MTGLEVPVFSPASGRAALSRGAGRLEVNHAGSYPQGGLTPDGAEVAALSGCRRPPAPLRVMIRPRGPPPAGPDFVYSGPELAGMAAAIRAFRAGGHLRAERGDGFVFGVLKRVEGRQGGGGGEGALVVDAERSRELVRLASPLPCVFHRAFDDVLGSGGPSAAEAALRAIADCGFDGVLTSGGPGSAAGNVETLARILQHATDLEIIIGGGVRSSNLQVLSDSLLRNPAYGGSRVWFHSSCLTSQSGDNVDEEEVEKIASGLDGFMCEQRT